MPMRDWLIGLGVAAALMLTTWATLIVLAKRLPPGILRDLAAFIPDCLTTIRSLRKNPQVPRKAKIAVIIAGLWVASPIDLIRPAARTAPWQATPGQQRTQKPAHHS
jgi:hypothetical protein